jgi:hypothetical protein
LVDHDFSSSFKISFQIRIHAALPYSIMGAICLQAAVLGLFLPETKGTPTLETMDDMNKDKGVALLVNSDGQVDRNENDRNES